MILSKNHPLRSSHRKSRFGCRECKKRHTKCDETRPSCNNCATSERQCSFTGLPRSSLVSIEPQKRVFESDCSTKIGSIRPSTTNSNGQKSGPSARHKPALLDEHYSLTHLELLHDFEHRLSPDAYRFLPEWGDLAKTSMREAFRSEYLMDALIAVAAAHRSTLSGENQNFYRNEATQLRTRSATKFNAQKEITEDYAIAAFLFTVFLGQLVLFDIFAEGGSLTNILDRLVHCMKLHQGVREVVAPVWHKLEPVFTCPLAEWDSDGLPTQIERNRECSPLWEMLDQSDISDSSRQIYSSSIDALQSMLDSSCASPTQRMPMVQQWLVRVPVGFVDLIKQRRPEALVILAYYSVLLHLAREFWAVGNAGRLLIELISAHLGDYWSHWLKWPNEMLNLSPVWPNESTHLNE